MDSSFHHEWEKCSKVAIGVAVTEKIYDHGETETEEVAGNDCQLFGHLHRL